MSAGAGALSDQDVDTEVLDGGIEHLLDVGHEAMDFVDEEDLLFADVGEDAGEVELLLEDGGGGLIEVDAEFVRDELGEGGFAEARGAEEEDVVEGFVALFGGLDGDGEIFLELGLAVEVGEGAGAESGFELAFGFVEVGGDDALIAHSSPRLAQGWRVSGRD